MRHRKLIARERNWLLVFVASILGLMGIILVALAVVIAAQFGWWSLLIGLSGLTTVVAAGMSIIKNDPSWILLDLIIPG